MGKRQRGLSIVELMVSVAISVAVLGALSYVYVGSRGAYRTNEALARVQETGRFALEWIARDLRQAGYMGCLSRGAPVTMYSYPPPPNAGLGSAVYGFELPTTKTGTAYVFSAPPSIAHLGGDVIVLSSLSGSAIAYVDKDYDAGNPANTKVVFSTCPNFNKDDVLTITDCQRAGIFTVTNNPSCSGGTATVTHASSSNGWPAGEPCPYANMACSTDFKFVPPYQKDDRAIVARLSQRGYFVGRPVGAKFAGRPPALYRFDSAGATEAVVENVEDLDFLFGVDVDGDGAVDQYRKADAVTEDGQWDRVLSVRVSLVAVSTEAAATPGGQVVFLRDEDGDSVVDAQKASADRRLRQVFTTTVALRNRLP
jgi:type IV pilus assembly protein PilW